MGKREIIIGALLAALGVGGSAVVSGMSMAANIYTPYLLSVGWLALVMAVLGLAVMFRTAPKAALVAAQVAMAGAPPREFVDEDITTEVLRKKVEGRTSLQVDAITKIYRGKWKRLQGRVKNVSAHLENRTFVQICPDDDSDNWASSAISFDKEWYDQVAALNIGDWISVIGKIDQLKSGVWLEGGEIVHMGEPPKIKTPPKPRVPRKKSAAKT